MNNAFVSKNNAVEVAVLDRKVPIKTCILRTIQFGIASEDYIYSLTKPETRNEIEKNSKGKLKRIGRNWVKIIRILYLLKRSILLATKLVITFHGP